MENNFRPVLTIRIFSEDKCFGPGIYELLENVRQYGSLRSAATSMNMAYSKAWRLVHECEEKLGFKLLTLSTGGKNGGGAEVTEEGKKLLTRYREMEKALNETAEIMLKSWEKEDNEAGGQQAP